MRVVYSFVCGLVGMLLYAFVAIVLFTSYSVAGNADTELKPHCTALNFYAIVVFCSNEHISRSIGQSRVFVGMKSSTRICLRLAKRETIVYIIGPICFEYL